jgi:hypothetical protein
MGSHADWSEIMTNKDYLSGPMAGYPENNFPAFQLASMWLRNQGRTIVSPHEIVHPVGTIAWHDFLRQDLIVMLQECKSIILLPGWSKSRGSRLELTVATALSMDVYHLMDNPYDLIDMGKGLSGLD